MRPIHACTGLQVTRSLSAIVLFLCTSPPFVAAQCASDDASYDFAYSPMTALTFYWSLGETTISSKLKYTGGGDVWLAVGPSKEGEMADSEVVLGSSSITPEKYELTGESMDGVQAMASSKQTLTGTSVALTEEGTEMTFEKILEEDGENTIHSSGATILVFSHGSSSSLGYHGEDRVAVSIDLSSCEAETIKSRTMNKFSIFCHAFLMIGAWMYIVPAGILSAVFKSRLGGAWIHVHQPLQGMAVAAALCGYGVIYLTVDKVGADHYNTAMTDYGRHTTLGGITLLFGVVQVIMGTLRPHNPHHGQKKSAKRYAFEFSHKSVGYASLVLALLSILSGVEHAETFNYIADGTPYHVALSLPLALFGLLWCFRFLPSK